MRGKEYLVAIRADGPLLVLETMFFADEVRDPKDVLDSVPAKAKPRPAKAKPRPAELRMASRLIESMSGDWDPGDYRDTFTDRVKKLIRQKKAGNEITVAEAPPEPTEVIDLLDALRRSVEATRSRGSRRGPIIIIRGIADRRPPRPCQRHTAFEVPWAGKSRSPRASVASSGKGSAT
ncbi:MAG TPA: hypothetical protein VF062_20190 [Candidatus Limnocylindrales bacterium]